MGKKEKKPLYKRKWIWALIILVVIIIAIPTVNEDAVGDNTQDDPEIENVKTPEPEQENFKPESKTESNPVSEPISETPIDEEISIESLSDLIEIVLSQRFPNYDISNDDKTITVNIWMDGVAIELAAIQENGGDANDESWMALKEGIGAMSDSICELIDESGQEDVYFTLNLLNDQNLENTLLTMLDSVIIYDVLE